MEYSHAPVMLKEALEYLALRPGGKYIDCTLGGAGYTLAMAAAVGPKGKILGIDLDELAIKNATREIALRKLKNIVLVQDNFKNLKKIAADNFSAATRFQGIVFDLGLSSAQLADEARGFSFKGERPLDMAFGPNASGVDSDTEVAVDADVDANTNRLSTVEIVNRYPLLELTRIFREYGEERRAYQLAKAIVAARRQKAIRTTADLTAIIEHNVPFRFHSRIHPATKVFQALRMETNGELAALSAVLPVAVSLLDKGGRLVVVSFHSGEDRIVKRFFKENEDLEILTKKPLVPDTVEIDANPRARSAKFRAAQKR
ncbi:MAG: 16S rRNA (cytosine(1402)-N(4))-methyltransferase [Patescibacteria group bacterium]